MLFCRHRRFGHAFSGSKRLGPAGPTFSPRVEALEERRVPSASVIATIPFGNSRGGVIAANAVTHRVYAAEEDNRVIGVINGDSNAILTTVPTQGYHRGIDVNSITNKIYVSQQFAGAVRIIDGATNTFTDLPVPGVIQTIGGLAVNPVTNRLYVVRANNNDLAVFDTTTNTFLGAVAFPSPGGIGDAQGVAVNTSTNLIYVANDLSNKVTIINGLTNTVLTTVAVGHNPETVSVDRATSFVYVTNYNSNSVSVIDGRAGSLTQNSVIATIPVGIGPLGIGINPILHHLYTSDNAGGTVSIVDENTNAVVQTLTVGGQPDWVAVIPATGRVFVSNDNRGIGLTVIAEADQPPVVTAPANQSAAEGASHSFNLGGFTDPDGGPWSVDVNWGDSTAHTTFTATSPGSLGTRSHTYAEEGSYTVTVKVTDNADGQSDSKTFTASVSDPPVAATGGYTYDASQSPGSGLQRVATFTDPGGPEPNASDPTPGISAHYAATISWGDGITSAGTITFDAVTGVFTVSGSHDYSQENNAQENRLPISVTITHEPAPPVTVTSFANFDGGPNNNHQDNADQDHHQDHRNQDKNQHNKQSKSDHTDNLKNQNNLDDQPSELIGAWGITRKKDHRARDIIFSTVGED